MSPRAEHRLALACALLCWGQLSFGQTIADYSRAQRLLLESAMSQAAARSAGLGGSAPAASASVPALAPPALPPRPSPRAAPTPAIQVNGVFASSSASVAEVVVDATPYLLQAGQGVPGTAWRVQSIAVDRVVLGRERSPAAGSQAVSRVFDLPALH